MKKFVLTVVTGTFLFSSVAAQQKIARPSPPSLDTLKSEVRGIFLHTWTDWPDLDLNLIAQTCINCGINTAVFEVYLSDFWQNGAVKDFPKLRTAIQPFHERGLKVHVLLVFGLTPPEPSMHVIAVTGEQRWLCFTKEKTRQAIKDIVESLARNYDIDGLMFDYIRWETHEMCFCDECKTRFMKDTGLNDANLPSDARLGGRYYWQFLQWRMNPITEIVRDVRNWILPIKPNLMFSAAVFSAFQNCGNYWPMAIGQHAADWIDKGYLDFVCPMIYTETLHGKDSVEQLSTDCCNFYAGGPEGKVPLVIFTTTGVDGKVRPIDNFVEATRIMKNSGADGWIIWRYGGPGFPHPSYNDVRPYLANLQQAGLMDPVWAIQNIKVNINPTKTQATISWKTTVLTKSKIEYAEHSLFEGTERFGDFGRPLTYKDIDYVAGTIKQNSTLKTQHSFTIPVTKTTQFRIQSIDEKDITVSGKPMPIFGAASVK